MALRFVVIAIATLLAAQTPPPRPPAMFSPWYAESLRDVLKLEASDAVRLEAKLAANPDDFPARLQLLAYHRRADRTGVPADRAKRLQHVLWLIEHHPDSELLHSPFTRFSTGEMAAPDYRLAVALWNAAAQEHPRDAAVQWNAASFFEELEPSLHLHFLEATAAADANHPFALRPLAHLYALSILNGGPLAARARTGLDASKNVWVLGNAAYMLQSQYNQTRQAGAPDARIAELSERYFLRAKALDPNLDRKAILPQVDLAAVARSHEADRKAQQEWQAHAEEATGRIRRLPVDSFPQLPPAVAAVLRARDCSVPQPSAGGAARNVIRGDFFANGESGWAVLCSNGKSTALLAFRNGGDTNPTILNTREDSGYLQDLGSGTMTYSREISAVGRDFVMQHYRAYGGQEPPPIDHHGIDDAFLGKASITWYFHDGKWLQLQGSD